MSGPLRLMTYRDEALSGLVVILTDDSRYAKGIMIDEELTTTSDLLEYRRQLLEHLCDKWHELFRERVRCIPPESEGQEWTIVRDSDEVIEGEVVTNELPAEPFDLDAEIARAGSRIILDTLAGRGSTNAKGPAIEGR